jgi:hypothetical protein
MDPQQSTKLAELKKQLEGLAGGQIDVAQEELVQLNFPMCGQTYTPDATVTFRRIILPGKFCSQMRLLDAHGGATTGTDGKGTFLLSGFLCSSVNSFAPPVNLLATPRSATPAYVTSTYTLVPNPNAQGTFQDLEITLFTWGANGKAAPNISVDWRCRLVAFEIIF